MLFVALALAAAIGLVVGLLGGGGSILSVPLLTYGAGMSPGSAVTTSLLIVGLTSAAALIPHARAGRVRWGTGLLFGPAGMAGAFVGGRLGSSLPDRAVMILFAIVMAASAWRMLHPSYNRWGACPKAAPSLACVIVLGSVVGLLTGTMGAGGGFLIVPSLVCVLGLPIHAAVGTSLLVITMNASAGLLGRIGAPQTTIDWQLALTVSAVAAVAAFAGAHLSGRVCHNALRRGFGWLVVAMAILVLVEQAF